MGDVLNRGTKDCPLWSRARLKSVVRGSFSFGEICRRAHVSASRLIRAAIIALINDQWAPPGPRLRRPLQRDAARKRPRSEIEQKVLAEMERFHAALPRLLPLYRGKWVIFKDGGVVDAFDDDNDAYIAAVKRFGRGSGFVLAQVVENAGSVLLSGAVVSQT